MNPVSTQRLAPTREGITDAAALLQKGALVAFPTETVYGLGADATNGQAVASIFAAKNRPSFNPLIVHVPDLETAETLVEFPQTARDIAQAFWPGPLTLVLPVKPGAVSDLVTAGLPTLAIRLPAHPLAQELLRQANRPIAAPSANPSGAISPTTADHVIAGLDGQIAAILDGGPCAVGLESTILGFDPAPTLLRPGGLPQEALEAALGAPLLTRQPDTPNAPGQLASHYAPDATVRLNITETDGTLLGFGAMQSTLNLSPAGDLTEAAANLFAYLRQLDTGTDIIHVAPIPETGLGRAINDRLRRAAAPR
ncbi:L-threonylcarbamoyladenylate synthase [Cognatishimia sp. MH4019]|uniref:L-threonylcarbamoyladenylate synthase n=1 Tax=Cognatishimia sp. MH4019 TaxID=2854030 RepID=UPI001CD400F5|nr:L-threonylcarbamoyladenylate synthase [Cognatishimia sp. MH4019]